METEIGKRIAWEMTAAAHERLKRAAELGREERENRELSESLGGCRAAAAKTKKEQRCTVVVPVPGS